MKPRPDNVDIHRFSDRKATEILYNLLIQDGFWVEKVDPKCFKTDASFEKMKSYLPLIEEKIKCKM